ncbi:MAG: hypothetical protein WBO69_01970, partial [Thermoanaerobaculia bacterium]
MRVLSLGLALALVSLPAAAEVKLKVLDDGTRVMYNEGRSRRTYGPPRTVTPSSSEELESLVARYS